MSSSVVSSAASTSAPASGGRERALEILMDRDPWGSYYRAARVMEETVPQAFASRPNLVTKSALVDQAFALGEYDIDDVAKYDAMFAERDGALAQTPPIDALMKERVLNHFTRLQAAAAPVEVTSPPSTAESSDDGQVASSTTAALVATLRQLFDTDAIGLRQLLTSVTNHYVLNTKSADFKQHIEAALLQLCKKAPYSYDAMRPCVDDDLFQGLILSILSLLITPPQETTTVLAAASPKGRPETVSASTHEPPPAPDVHVQVASLLALLPVPQEEESYSLSSNLLDYFGRAASVAEERIEVQKARHLLRIETPAEEKPLEISEVAEAAASAPEDALHVTFERLVSSMAQATVSDEPFASLELVASMPHREEGEEMPAGDESSDLLRLVQRDLGRNSSSSCSSSSSSSSSDSFSYEGDADRALDTDDDEDAVLRQAFAMSSQETTGSGTHNDLEPPYVLTEDLVEEVEVVTPVGSIDVPEGPDDDDDSDLPPFPSMPASLYVDEFGEIFDPTALSRFGALPSSRVLAHLLRYSCAFVERRRLAPLLPMDLDSKSTAPGGMGFGRVTPKKSLNNGRRHTKDDSTLQLLVAMILLVHEQRNNCLEGLKNALSREQRLVQPSEGVSEQTQQPSSGEEDDPAMALALNYVEDDVPLSSDSLENKGMRRKAAAAAYDAAALLLSLRKETAAWRERVLLYSQSLRYCLKIMRLFLQYIVRQSLHEGLEESSPDYVGRLPRSIAEKLLTVLNEHISSISYPPRHGGLGDEADRYVQTLALYKESLLSWGECIPFLFPSEEAIVALLERLLLSCSASLPTHVAFQPIESIGNLPASTSDCDFQRLNILCRRLRVSDLLDVLLSKPIPYLPVSDEDRTMLCQDMAGRNLKSESFCGLAVIGRLVHYLSTVGDTRNEIHRLYLALCHRCHIRILLFDGLYASMRTESDDVATSASRSKITTGGDYVRLSSNPSSALEFDSAKCADSIAILSESSFVVTSSVLQRATKVWGTVLATRYFAPKSGVHRWAVRLDRCERGHVFIGVATSQCSMQTYVGGDKHGWGMIGTQALWHDRRKVRGDYGSTLRSGATVIVTLDSDVGTMSFGLWEDSNSSPSIAVDPLVQNIVSPKRQGLIVGTVEDWGVAFEGLPLDSRLYPAVGLYQRDDKVTLLPVVENLGKSSLTADGVPGTVGECYYPPITDDVDCDTGDAVNRVRNHNDALAWHGIVYVAETLGQAVEHLDKDTVDLSLTRVLPVLAAAICLAPSTVPTLSTRFALALMPRLRNCIDALSRFLDKRGVTNFFPSGIRKGRWIFKSIGSTSNNAESDEYSVDISHAMCDTNGVFRFNGKTNEVPGKTKTRTVTIAGVCRASSIVFVEDWSGRAIGSEHGRLDSSTFVITGRTSLDGKRFEGSYRSTDSLKTGQVSGCWVGPSGTGVHLDEWESDSHDTPVNQLALSLLLLCMAQSHLAALLDDSPDFKRSSRGANAGELGETGFEFLNQVMGLSIFSDSSIFHNQESAAKLVESLMVLFRPPETVVSQLSCDEILRSIYIDQDLVDRHQFLPDRNIPELDARVAKADELLAVASGGTGSLLRLCPSLHSSARRKFILVCLCYSGLVDDFAILSPSGVSQSEFYGTFCDIWRHSTLMIEDGLRKAISVADSGKSKQQLASEFCQRYEATSDFLLSLNCSSSTRTSNNAMEIIRSVATAHELIGGSEHIAIIKGEMIRTSKHALLRICAFSEILGLVTKFKRHNMVALEASLLSLPHILGRSRATVPSLGSQKEKRCFGSSPNLDGNYVSGISGAATILKTMLRNTVLNLFRNLGDCLRHQACITPGSDETDLNAQSAALTILPIFATQYLRDDFDPIMINSGILTVLRKILSDYRTALITQESHDADIDFLSRRISSTFRKELCLSVIRCATFVSHTILYQAAFLSIQIPGIALRSCTELLLEELPQCCAYVEKDARTKVGDAILRSLEGDIQALAEIESKDGRTSSSLGSCSKNSSASDAILYLGMFGLNKKSSTHIAVQHDSCVFVSQTLQDLVSHWLHSLCAILKSPVALASLVQGGKCLRMLLERVGIMVEYSSEGKISFVYLRSHSCGIMPARFRSRILRLILPLTLATPPEHLLVEGLFEFAGITSSLVTRSFDEDESILCSECISLVRHLHSPAHVSWRDCVNLAISNISSNSNGLRNIYCKSVGVLSFFCGGFGGVSRGSHVILKPANAVALSNDLSSSTNSKAHTSSVGGTSSLSGTVSSPHHLIGNGTESIVSGLSINEAAAGVVSSIDFKNGLCEVILFPRSDDTDKFGFENVTRNRTSRSSKKSSYGRQALTVRALRTPLADTFLAQEVPLVLDESVPVSKILSTMLQDALTSLLSAVKVEKTISVDANAENTGVDDDTKVESLKEPITRNVQNRSEDKEQDVIGPSIPQIKEEAKKSKKPGGVRSGILGLASEVQVVQCCIVILSHESILRKFINDPRNRETLGKLLCLSWPEPSDASSNSEYVSKIRMKSLSSIVLHEARAGHLLALFRETSLRLQMLDMQQDSFWLAKVNESTVPRSTMPKSSSPDHALPQSMDRVHVESTQSGNDLEHSRSASQGTSGSISEEEDDDDGEGSSTTTSHLREAAIAQMAELGLPRSWSVYALRRVGDLNVEAAVTFCLECGGDMERLIAEERDRERSTRRRELRDNRASNHLVRQLLEMGFPLRWCMEALAVTGNNVDEALTWILNNAERLSELDDNVGAADGEILDEEDDDSVDDDDDDDGDEASGKDVTRVNSKEESGCPSTNEEDDIGWSASINPVRFVSGRAIIDSRTLEVSGLPNGSFASVGTKGVLLTTGKWYYEAILESAGCLQIGWADGSFSGHCHADRGDGCGDGPSSWAYDGWRRYRWHSIPTEWGCRWKKGDVVGCLVDMDAREVAFTLNGHGESVGMGIAFSGEGFRPCGGVYACVSFNRRERLRLILGGSGSASFKHGPPPGYRGVGEAILEAVKDRDNLVGKEKILGLNLSNATTGSKAYLCDFSDGEHGHELMAWGHRYYGADASVHLGSGNVKHSTVSSKSGGPVESADTPDVYVSRRLSKARSELSFVQGIVMTPTALKDIVKKSYEEVEKSVAFEIFNECIAMAILFSRRLILHVAIALGDSFDPNMFLPDESQETQCLLRLWRMFNACCSLQNAGWAGEAGAMAIAAELLGLGISSNDQAQQRSIGDRSGIVASSDLDSGLQLAVVGNKLLLNSVKSRYSCHGSDEDIFQLLACAEVALCAGGGGGLISFLKPSLQSVAMRSCSFLRILIAAIRRAVRTLSVVEYDGDDTGTRGIVEDDEEDGREEEELKETDLNKPESEFVEQADARLASFLTGLILTVSRRLPVSGNGDEIMGELAQAWSVGLLSASLPWRMICAFTVAGIINEKPQSFHYVILDSTTLCRYYGRLPSTVARRMWAERAAVPVCSRYIQAMIELLTAVNRAVGQAFSLPEEFSKYWWKVQVDAATPLPLDNALQAPLDGAGTPDWQSRDCWVCSDSDWEVWTGVVEYRPVEWKTPPRSSVHALMDGGDGPPFLDIGCTVMRGPDWDKDIDHHNEDGKTLYDAEKLRCDLEKQKCQETEAGDCVENRSSVLADSEIADDPAEPLNNRASAPPTDTEGASEFVNSEKKQRKCKRKSPSPLLPTGLVLSIEAWNGVPGVARRVRWQLTGTEGVYRFGGDGGRFDLCHVETNKKGTKVKKKHPLPETAEQCSARHGFGKKRCFPIILRLRRSKEGPLTGLFQGILEWPDFGAGAKVSCRVEREGSFLLREEQLIFGAKDCGWEVRFGQPSYVEGSTYLLTSSKENDGIVCEEICGEYTYDIRGLRNPGDGGRLSVSSKMRLRRANEGLPNPPPLCFDPDYHASTLSLSRDCRTLSCVASEGRGTAFASIGFTKGVHYWEVKLEQADIGSVFIGVAEKARASGSGSSFIHDTPVRLNRWHGWGFVNFRATYTSGAERVYGAHCHAGDTVGVLLDCDAGRLSFFFDGLKYGEHILNDLGCAFENLSPFGFNVDGCFSGGAGQGAPNGFDGGRVGRNPSQEAVRPRSLFPVVGLRNQGDRVTISSKWSTSYGIDGVQSLRNILRVDEILNYYMKRNKGVRSELPYWLVDEAFLEYKQWIMSLTSYSDSRGSGPYTIASFGLDLQLNTSPKACASASASLGLDVAFLAGDRVRLLRSAGRILELAEEAIIIGTVNGRLYYKIVSQKSEGGSLTEGGGRSWCLDESEVVDSLPFIRPGKGLGIPLPKLDRFTCPWLLGLKVVHEGGAVLRSDLEIFDGSLVLGTLPLNFIVQKGDIVERRLNSCGTLRYRICHEEYGKGWISSRIRGGKEELIVEEIVDDISSQNTTTFATPDECASIWYEQWEKAKGVHIACRSSLTIESRDAFKQILETGTIPGLSLAESDSLFASVTTAISNCTEEGSSLHVSFEDVVAAIAAALLPRGETPEVLSVARPALRQAALAILYNNSAQLPSITSILTRIALLRAFNRRIRVALPWLSVRPFQEGSAILGGLTGHGTSVTRCGRSWLVQHCEEWFQAESLGSLLRTLRKLVFTSVKREFLDSVTAVTTTPTPLSPDEYELPREIRTVRINRLKAGRAMLSHDNVAKRKYSVFAQLQSETKNWGGAALRRGYVAKGHGGQKRAFKVKLIGEGVNDYSGPYREVFTDAFAETMKTREDHVGCLGVLEPTPNSVCGIGDDRDLFMFSLNGRVLHPDCSNVAELPKKMDGLKSFFGFLTLPRDEASREVEDSLVFLGRLVGVAYRHGLSSDVPLPLESIWKALAEESSTCAAQLSEIDQLALRHLGEDRACNSSLLLWQQRLLNSFSEGLSSVVPVELLPLMTGEELRESICGNPEVDVDLLELVVEYEGYEPHDQVIEYFWETLREMTNDERKRFLQFVWARNRLPLRQSDFEAPFKIQKDTVNSGDKADCALPSASTCFFSLTLPAYSTREILRAKLLFAITNVTTMETDFQTNNSEISEGYRAF